MATNAPLQGTAADIIKIAIVQIEDTLVKAGLRERAHLVLQVHDELVYEVEETAKEDVQAIVVKAMISVMNNSPIKLQITPIPLAVSVAKGKRLDELK